ncbi:MAG: NusG domain II-containing protein [Bacillota bacterium]
MKSLKVKTADYFIIGFIVLTGLSVMWFNLQVVSAAGQKYATVHLKNEQVVELSLSEGETYDYEITFGKDNQHAAEVEVKNGRVRMLPISEELCPKAICSHTGWIEHSYESIVCLPNKIMIDIQTFSPGESDNDIDGVTY